MSDFHYVNSCFFVESVNANEIMARFGTPVYVYSQATIDRNWRKIHDALASQLTFSLPTLAYAVKANSSLAILNLLARMGSSFDVVSGGEMQRVLKAGGAPEKIFFSGVGKTEQEILDAIHYSIGCIHVESIEELNRIEQLAAQERTSGKLVSVALRINPDVNPNTHPYIATGLKENKFGIELKEAKKLYQQRNLYPHLQFTGIACHIGSQILELAPYLEALSSLLNLYDELVKEGLVLEHLDLGGGFGITYQDEDPFDLDAFAKAVAQVIGSRPLKLMVEPGRSVVGNAGILLTKVEYLKNNQDKHFVIVDAGMNDLLRPALYQAVHPIWPVKLDTESSASNYYDIVGPICETGDFLAKNQPLPVELKAGDYLAIGMTGAYGFSMSSHYNTRAKVAEVLIDGDKMHLIRSRETFEDLIRGEIILY